MSGDHIHGREVEDDFFTRFDPDWRNDGTGDDDLTCVQLFAENGEQVGGVTNDVDEFASQVLQALWFVDAAVRAGSQRPGPCRQVQGNQFSSSTPLSK
jgi:hypothetical protein